MKKIGTRILTLPNNAPFIAFNAVSDNFSLDTFTPVYSSTNASAAVIRQYQHGHGGVTMYTINHGADGTSKSLSEDYNIAMHWRHDGNVGIGTTSPGQKLTVVDGNIELTNSGGTHGGVLTYDGSSGELRLKAKSGKSLVLGADNSNSQMVLGYSGNVGINTTSPEAKLDVNGGDIIVRDHDGGEPSILLDIASGKGVRIYANLTGCGDGTQLGSASGRYLCWIAY